MYKDSIFKNPSYLSIVFIYRNLYIIYSKKDLLLITLKSRIHMYSYHTEMSSVSSIKPIAIHTS